MPQNKKNFSKTKFDSKAAFKAFLSSTNQKRQTADVINMVIKELLNALWEEERKRPLRIADIGCADGKTCALYLSEVEEFNYTGVDISKKYLSSASKFFSTQSNCKEITTIKGDVFNNSKVKRKLQEKNPFDIIFISHSLYYMEAKQYTRFLKNMQNCLSPKGILISIHQKIIPNTMPYFRQRYTKEHSMDVPRMLINTMKENNFSTFLPITFNSHFNFGEIPEAYWEKLKNISSSADFNNDSEFINLFNKLNFILQRNLGELCDENGKNKKKLHQYLNEIRFILESNHNRMIITSYVQFLVSPFFQFGPKLEKIIETVQINIMEENNGKKVEGVYGNHSFFSIPLPPFHTEYEEKENFLPQVMESREGKEKGKQKSTPTKSLAFSFFKDNELQHISSLKHTR